MVEVLAVDLVNYSNSFDDGRFMNSSQQIDTSCILNALTRCNLDAALPGITLDPLSI